MTGIITRLITALNLTKYLDKNKLSCPFHQDPGTKLNFISGDNVPSQVYFKCSDRRCGFRGDAVDLIKRFKKINTEKVFEMMYPGNILSGVFIGEENVDKNVLLSKLKDVKTHQHIKAFLTECNANLVKNPNYLGKFLHNDNLEKKTLEAYGIGLLTTHRDNWPAAMLNLKLPKKTNWYTIPYSINGRHTAVALIDCDDRSKVIEVSFDTSIVPEGVASWHRLDFPAVGDLIICDNPITAITLFSRLNIISSGNCNICAVLNPSAIIPKLYGLKSVILLEEQSSKAGNLLNNWKEYNYPGLDVKVMEVGCPIDTLPPSRLLHLKKSQCRDIIKVIAERLSKNYSDLGELPLTGIEKDNAIKLLARAGTSRPALATLRAAKTADTVAAYGNIKIKRSSNCYIQINPEHRVLSNFIFIPEKLMKRDQISILAGKVICDGIEFPMELPVKEASGSGSRLANYIWEEAVKKKIQVKPYAAKLNNLDWLSLIRLFDTVEYSSDSGTLGVFSNLINFPEIQVDMSLGLTSPLKFSGPEAVMAELGNIKYSSSISYDKLTSFPAARGITGKLFITATAHFCRELINRYINGLMYEPTHLIIPYFSQESPGYMAIRGLCRTLSGSPLIPSKPAVAGKRGSGGIPRLLRLDSSFIPTKKLLREIRHSLIILLDPKGIDVFNFMDNVLFLDDDGSSEGLELPPDLTEAVSELIPELLHETAGAAERPLSAYLEALPIDIAAGCAKLITPHYASPGDNIHYREFIQSLVIDWFDSKLQFAPSRYAFRRNKNKWAGYWQGDKLFLRSRVCCEYIAMKHPRINMRKVSAALLSDNNKGCGICKGEWFLTRQEWAAASGLKIITDRQEKVV